MSIKTIENMVNWVEENLEECPNLEKMSNFVGFSSHEAFTRAFVRIYGYTPFQYRKLLPEILTFDRAQIDH